MCRPLRCIPPRPALVGKSTRVVLPVVELLSGLAQDDALSEAQQAEAGALAKQVGSELFTQLADDMDYFIRLDDDYYFASDQSIQMAMAVTQRISGALQDALPEDADVKAMAERMKQVRQDNNARQRGQFSDPPAFDPDAQP